MTDYTPHQRKIIDRYYEHKADIMLARLGELVGELYLADTDKQRDRLWQRVDLAMKNLKVPPREAARIMEKRDPRLLAEQLKEWLRGGG
jgi:hypothetical protein